MEVAITAGSAPALAAAGHTRALLFMGSPRAPALEDLQRQGLFVSDIPLHDMSRDFALLSEQLKAEANLKEQHESMVLILKHTTKASPPLCASRRRRSARAAAR